MAWCNAERCGCQSFMRSPKNIYCKQCNHSKLLHFRGKNEANNFSQRTSANTTNTNSSYSSDDSNKKYNRKRDKRIIKTILSTTEVRQYKQNRQHNIYYSDNETAKKRINETELYESTHISSTHNRLSRKKRNYYKNRQNDMDNQTSKRREHNAKRKTMPPKYGPTLRKSVSSTPHRDSVRLFINKNDFSQARKKRIRNRYRHKQRYMDSDSESDTYVQTAQRKFLVTNTKLRQSVSVSSSTAAHAESTDINGVNSCKKEKKRKERVKRQSMTNKYSKYNKYKTVNRDHMRLNKENEKLHHEKLRFEQRYLKVTDELNGFKKQMKCLKNKKRKAKQGSEPIIATAAYEMDKLRNENNKLKKQMDELTQQNNYFAANLKLAQMQIKKENVKQKESKEIIETLEQQLNGANTYHLRQQIDELNKMVALLKSENEARKKGNMAVDDNKNQFDHSEIYKFKFKHWLDHSVKLSQYLTNFATNECDDIRMIEFLDEDTIKNDIGIHNKLHCKLILKKVKQFRKSQMEFFRILNNNKPLYKYKEKFEENGILTLQDVYADIQTQRQLGHILGIKDKNTVSLAWNIIYNNEKNDDVIVIGNEGQKTNICL